VPDVTPPVAALALVIGVDIGNSTTEACIADVGDGEVGRLASSLTRTTGVKGTPDNTTGAVTAVRRALEATGRRAGELATVLLNEATPVIRIVLPISMVMRVPLLRRRARRRVPPAARLLFSTGPAGSRPAAG